MGAQPTESRREGMKALKGDEGVTQLRGVHTHNLKGIDCDIPHGKLTVVTGVSGSGKSSLAFDTLYAEGQRRYTESLSTYARQFLRRMERPPVDAVRHIQPAVALRQHNEVQNARSTVGTITEIDDHLHLLFTHLGQTVCPRCDLEVKRDTMHSIVAALMGLEEGTRLVLVAQVHAHEQDHRPIVLKQLVTNGYRRLWMGGEVVDLDGEEIEALLDQDVYDVVVDRVVVGPQSSGRVAEAVEAALGVGDGKVWVYEPGNSEPMMSFDKRYCCNGCGRDFIVPQPALFSFNSSLGACAVCSGFGKTIGLDFKKVIPNPRLSIKAGAIAPFQTPKYKTYQDRLLKACMKAGVPIDLGFKTLTREHQRLVREGGSGWMGVRAFFKTLEQKQYKTHVRILLARYRGYDVCEACEGGKLCEDARQVFVHGRRISDFWEMRLEEMRGAFESIEWTEQERARGQVLIDEIMFRLKYLETVGLGYLSLGRQSRTLSGGETQRIHLTSSLGRALTDTLYVLDEPTAGLHARDSAKLLHVLYKLRDLGNTVVVVEHDPEIIEGADHILEIGPQSGEKGGSLMWAGPCHEFLEADHVTSRMLRARRKYPAGGEPQRGMHEGIRIVGAREHNLDDLSVTLPYGKLSVVTGVSGSGKSTLLGRTLYNGWRRMQGQGGVESGAVDALEGLEVFEDVVMMNQDAMGRSSRSNALSYTKAYDDVRKLFSQTEAARKGGVTVGDFSFNTPGGRCEHCQGAGVVVVEMHFMADIEIQCAECQGRRFSPRVLGVNYKGKSIDEVFGLTVTEGLEFFGSSKPIVRKLEPLRDVGLGYLRLGQTTSTLSGGEAQRLKLATYIAQGQRRGETKPVLFIFDEPTVGLHLQDVNTLLGALRQLVELGHTVVVIEHNTDFIAQCDWVLDIGPGAGPQGGRLVAAGPPWEVSKVEASVTGQYLKGLFES